MFSNRAATCRRLKKWTPNSNNSSERPPISCRLNPIKGYAHCFHLRRDTERRVGWRFIAMTTRINKFFKRYWYFIIGVLVVSLAYGLVKAFKRNWANRAPELPEVQRIVYDRFILPNGLEVIVHRDATVPTVSVNMSYHVGARDEPRGKTGLAHLTEHL